MSQKRSLIKCSDNQCTITSFIKTPKPSDLHERTKKLIESRKQEREKHIQINAKQEREKHQFPYTPDREYSNQGSTSKRKTPPSVNREEITDLSKRLHFSEPTPPKMNPESETSSSDSKDSNNAKINTTPRDDLILARLDTIQESIRSLQLDWKRHTEELSLLKSENNVLTSKVRRLEKKNTQLGNRLKHLEDKLLENNIIFQGIPESIWESEEVCKEKIIQVISVLVNSNTPAGKLEGARNIPINTVKRLVVEFGYKGDAEYVLQNKKRIHPGVFVEREYGIETSKNRRLLKPIFNAAR